MTREEAIKELKEDIELYTPLHGTIDDVDRDLPDGRLITALEMGIKALEQEPCEDAIRKTDIVELLRRGRTYAFHHPEQYKTEREADIVDTLYVNLIQAVDKLPPVNPQYTEDEIQKMQDIEQAEIEKAYELGKTEGQESEDAIRRQAVIDIINFEDKWLLDAKGHNADTEIAFSGMKSKVSDLPPVNPQPKMGRWIPVSERLPEEREWYLAVFEETDTGFQLIPRVADYIGRGENKWRLIDEKGLSFEYQNLLKCVAWMPLPKPYEPQESEGKE